MDGGKVFCATLEELPKMGKKSPKRVSLRNPTVLLPAK
jgi:hypothetical protein